MTNPQRLKIARITVCLTTLAAETQEQLAKCAILAQQLEAIREEVAEIQEEESEAPAFSESAVSALGNALTEIEMIQSDFDVTSMQQSFKDIETACKYLDAARE